MMGGGRVWGMLGESSLMSALGGTVEIAAATASRIDQSSHFSGAEEEEEEEEGGRASPAYGPFLPLPKCHL